MFRTICHSAIGVVVAALVVQTWLVMGLVAPITVSGSSMAPTLVGAHRMYRCTECEGEFPIAIEDVPRGEIAVCPHCRIWSAVANSGDLPGNRLWIDRTAFTLRNPRRWEVVVFRSPHDAQQLCVKRIVGLPGETIAIAAGGVVVNGQHIAHPRGTKYEIRSSDKTNSADGWRLGPGEYFVLGDNAAVSDDSRNWRTGPGLDEKLLVGKALGVE